MLDICAMGQAGSNQAVIVKLINILIKKGLLTREELDELCLDLHGYSINPEGESK